MEFIIFSQKGKILTLKIHSYSFLHEVKFACYDRIISIGFHSIIHSVGQTIRYFISVHIAKYSRQSSGQEKNNQSCEELKRKQS